MDDNISYVDVTELFVTGDTPAGGSDVTSTIGKIDSPIKDLKIVVLSLDWEITDKTMQNFAEEINRLEEMWAADKILIAFLKILGALGQYIAKKKARAHPNSVKLLYSVYNALEKVVLTGDMPVSQKKEIVAHELRKYMKLKKQFDITASPADKPGKVEESEIVTRDQEVAAAPEVEMAPAVVQPLPEQVPEPEAAEPSSQAKEIIPELSKKISFSEIDNRLDEFFNEEPEIEEKQVLFKEPVGETRQEAVAPPPLEVPGVELQVEDLLVDEVKVPASEVGKKVTPQDEAELKLELMEEEEEPPAVAVAEEEVSVEDAVIPFEFEDEYRDEKREEKGEEVAVDPVEEFSVPIASLMESLEKLISSSINGDADQQTIEDFSQEIRNAKDAWQDEPEITIFLNIMNSLGKSVTLPVKDAALNSVTLLRSVISSMEVVLSSHDETKADNREILFREMNKYILHQEQLVLSAISTHPAGVEPVSEKKSVPPPVPEYELDEQAQPSETEESSYEEEIAEENGAIFFPKSKRALPGFLEKLKNLFK